MTVYEWVDVREDAIGRLGDAPPAEVEARILVVFERSPQHVVAAVDRAALSLAAGSIRYPWSLVAKLAEGMSSPGAAVRATDASDRDRAVANAMRWLQNAGLHYDRWEEILETLFGDTGRLRAWKQDGQLLQELELEWLRLRPAGERVEAEAEERAARWIEDRKQMDAMPRVVAIVNPEREEAK